MRWLEKSPRRFEKEEPVELFYRELKMRSVFGYLAVPVIIVALGLGIVMLMGGCMMQEWLPRFGFGLFGLSLLFLSISFLYGFARNEVRRFGIRDDAIWWDSPRWPRSSGSIPLDNVNKVTILEGEKLLVTMQDGTVRRVPWRVMGETARTVLIEHYPHVAVKFIRSSS